MLCFGHRARREEAAQLAPWCTMKAAKEEEHNRHLRSEQRKKTLKQSKGALVHSPFCGAPSAALKQAL